MLRKYCLYFLFPFLISMFDLTLRTFRFSDLLLFVVVAAVCCKFYKMQTFYEKWLTIWFFSEFNRNCNHHSHS